MVRPFFSRRRGIISQRRRLCKHAGSFLPPDSRAQPNLSVFIRVSWTYCSLLQRGWQQIPYCITHRAGVLVLTHTCGVDFRDPAGKSLRGSLANGFCCVCSSFGRVPKTTAVLLPACSVWNTGDAGAARENVGSQRVYIIIVDARELTVRSHPPTDRSCAGIFFSCCGGFYFGLN